MYTRKAYATREAPRRGSGMTNRTPARDRPGALGWRRGSLYRGSRVMPVEGRDLSSRRTQYVVRDLEIGEPINSEECSETADGVACESEGRSRLSLLCPVRQDQPRRHPGSCLCPVPLQQGRAVSSSGCVTKPKGREIGLIGFAVQIQLCSLTGSYVMATAEHREPYVSRGSRTVLGAPGGEIPPGDSTNFAMGASLQHGRFTPIAVGSRTWL